LSPFVTDNPGAHNHNNGVFNLLLVHDGNFTIAGGTDNLSGGYQPNLNTPAPIVQSGAHVHTITGGGDAETRPRNAGVYWIIKVQ
jgi:hypothetical protein